MSETVLEVRDLTAGYTRAHVLHEVSMHVQAGELVGLLGANGAGKTTLLRALSGMLPTARGSISLGSHSLNRLRPWGRAQLGLAHVPEGRHIFAPLTVAENLAAALLIKRPGGVTRDEVFDLFPRLKERLDQPAGSMSGGEQQMLAVARALLQNPVLLAIDEMSAGLAPAVSQQLIDALVALRQRGIAMLLVEQSPQLLETAVDRVYLLEHGRMHAGGSFADLGGSDGLAQRYLGVHQEPAAVV